jgi:hypothetical protein
MRGAAVDLYAWPSDAVLTGMKPGQVVPVTLLAKAITDTAGGFMLRVPAARLKSAAATSGYVNLEIYSPFGGIWFFSYLAGALPARLSPSVTVRLGGRAKPPPCGLQAGGQPYHFSGFTLEHHRAPAWAVVGQGYIVRSKQTSGDTASFSYTTGSSHSQTSELGVGISGYGFDAGYNGAGTHASTATRAEGFPNSSGNAWFRTMFSTGQFRGVCYGNTGITVPRVKQHGKCPRTYLEAYVHKCLWMIQSTGWFGGASTVHPGQAPRTPSRYCAPYEKGSHFDGDFGTAVQWSSGFELGASLGVKGVDLKASFNGSAQTGYDADAVMDYHFGHAGYICGTNKPPAKAAILVQRGNKAQR